MLNIVDIQIDYREGNIRIRTEPKGTWIVAALFIPSLDC